MPFFKWNNLWKKYPQYKDLQLQMVLAPRNIGKSTDTYELLKETAFTPQDKIVLMRNTDTELQTMKGDFNNRFAGKYKFSGDFIYQLKDIAEENKTSYHKRRGAELKTLGDVIGYGVAVSTYTKYKSIEAKDIKYIFYEEFNEDTALGRNIYANFINLITTLIRFSKTKILMLGNKDSFNNDFFVNWDIVPKENFEKDEIFEIKGANNKTIGVCYDLGTRQFDDLNNSTTLFYELGQMDNRTKNYIQGGYKHAINNAVKNYKSIITNFQHKFNFQIDTGTYALGKWNDVWAVLSPWNFEDMSKPRYALTRRGNLSGITLKKDETNEIYEFLVKAFKQQKLIFDSYDTLINFENVAIMWSMGQ